MKKVISTVAAVLVAFSFITAVSVTEVRAEGPEGDHAENGRVEKKIEKRKEMKKAIKKEKKRKMKKAVRKEEKKELKRERREEGK